MRSKPCRIIVGAVVVLLGVALFGSSTGLWNFDLLFNGWWGALLMLIAVCGMISDKPNIINAYLLIFGGIAVLHENDVIIKKSSSLWLLALYLLIIVIGARIVSSAVFSKKHADSDDVSEKNNTSFSSSELKFDGLEFSSGSYDVTFGSLRLDFRGAKLAPGANVKIECAFASAEVIVSPDTSVSITKSGGVCGSVKSDAPNGDPADLTIDAEAAFGSVSVKTK